MEAHAHTHTNHLHTHTEGTFRVSWISRLLDTFLIIQLIPIYQLKRKIKINLKSVFNHKNPPLSEIGGRTNSHCWTLGNITCLPEYISHYYFAVAGICESLLFKAPASDDLRALLQTIMELFSFQRWQTVGSVYFPKGTTSEELVLEREVTFSSAQGFASWIFRRKEFPLVPITQPTS